MKSRVHAAKNQERERDNEQKILNPLFSVHSHTFQGFGSLDKLGNPLFSLADENGGGERHAALTGGAKRGADQLIERVFFIGVWHDDAVILGAHVGLNAFAPFGSFFVNVLTGLIRADEGDGANVGVVDDKVDRAVCAVDYVDAPIGNACFRMSNFTELLVKIRDRERKELRKERR